MPPRVLPWLYFGCAWIALALAFAAIAADPRAAAGFYYHAHLAGIVHLVTLGWITMSILGALYVVGPIALRTPLPARRGDALAFASVVIGIIGMVGHFWIEEFSGMGYSGVMVVAGVLYVGSRVVRGLRAAPIPTAVKLHVVLAFANIAVAATIGVLLAFDKVFHFLPGFVLANVIAHAHFAAIGWASMMVVGVGYRLIPMLLPSQLPSGRSVYVSAILLETGVLGLFTTLVLQSTWVPLFAAITVGGFLSFAAHVAWMVRRRRTPPVNLPKPDYAVRHAWLALGSLGVAVVLGVTLALVQTSEITLRAALAYGVFGLVGFLAQMVAGVQIRLLPLLGWYTYAHTATDMNTVPSPQSLMVPRLAATSWLLWLWGVPAVAVGFAVGAIPLLTAGAVALEAAVLMGAVQAGVAARRAFAGRRVRPRAPHLSERAADGFAVGLRS